MVCMKVLCQFIMSLLAIRNVFVAFFASLISKSYDLKALDPGVYTACKQEISYAQHWNVFYACKENKWLQWNLQKSVWRQIHQDNSIGLNCEDTEVSQPFCAPFTHEPYLNPLTLLTLGPLYISRTGLISQKASRAKTILLWDKKI